MFGLSLLWMAAAVIVSIISYRSGYNKGWKKRLGLSMSFPVPTKAVMQGTDKPTEIPAKEIAKEITKKPVKKAIKKIKVKKVVKKG